MSRRRESASGSRLSDAGRERNVVPIEQTAFKEIQQ
jgi:hypothetical protein